MRVVTYFCGNLALKNKPEGQAFASSHPSYPTEDTFESFLGSAVDADHPDVDFTLGLTFTEYIAVAEALAIAYTMSAEGYEYRQWFNNKNKSSLAYDKFQQSRKIKPANVACGGERVKSDYAEESWLCNVDSAEWRRMHDINVSRIWVAFPAER